jgi:D-galactarolactone cycloisomerase
MKVTSVRTYVLSRPLARPFAFSQGWVHRRSALLVEVETDAGLSGWGEAVCMGLEPPEIASAVVEHALAPLVVGADPWAVEVLWERMYGHTRDYGQKGAVLGAISAVDVALWDLMGRASGRSVSALLGGRFRSRVRPYATGFYRLSGPGEADRLVGEAGDHLEAGFPGMKVKIGFGLDDDVGVLRAVRRAVGEGVFLMADANHAYAAADAIRVARVLADLGYRWFEEPVPPEDYEGSARVRSAGLVPVATGENEFAHFGFHRLLLHGAADILQPDLCHAGGFTALRKIVALAQAWNTPVVPHVWGTAVHLAASLQLIAALPPIPYGLYPEEPLLEYDRSAHPFRTALVRESSDLLPRDGWVTIPDGPGLGVTVDREALARLV